MNTTISLCRCKAIKSSLAVVAYQVNATTYGKGFKNSIYTDFFAMKYWRESFGFIAVVIGFVVLLAGHILIWLLDGRLRRNLVIRLREKARNFELKHGASMLREDGLFLKNDQRDKFNMKPTEGAKLASTKKFFKEGDDDIVINEKQSKTPEQTKAEKAKKRKSV